MPYNTTAIPPRKEPTGTAQLPLSRIKRIIAQDQDISICSNNAAFVITLAAEMFIQHLAEESHTQAKVDTKPRRNIQYKDVANAVARQDNLEFLEDVVPKTVPFKNIKKSAADTQARLRGEHKTGDESAGAAAGTRPVSAQADKTPTTNGADLAEGDASLQVLQSPMSRERVAAAAAAAAEEDPNSQLEMEMRQAHGGESRDGDVQMTG